MTCKKEFWSELILDSADKPRIDRKVEISSAVKLDARNFPD
jgi:hypothetical protein